MNSDTQLKVQAYLDNELSSSEARKVAGLISSDREAQELYDQLRAMKELMAGNEPEVKVAESRDFYWSQIQRRIASAEREVQPKARTAWWIRLLAPVAGTAALAALLISVMNPGTQVTSRKSESFAARPLHGEVEDLAPDVSSVTFRSEQDGVTVVWLTARE